MSEEYSKIMHELQSEKERKALLPNTIIARAKILYAAYLKKMMVPTGALTDKELLEIKGVAPLNPVVMTRLLQKDGLLEIQKIITNKDGVKVKTEAEAVGGKVEHKYYITHKAIKHIEYCTQGVVDDDMDYAKLASGLGIHIFCKSKNTKTCIDMNYVDEVNVVLNKAPSVMNVGNKGLPPELLSTMMDKILLKK